MEQRAPPASCSCSVDNILSVLKNDSVKEMLRGPIGPEGRPGLPGLTVSWKIFIFNFFKNLKI
jgi:hypothetical protein